MANNVIITKIARQKLVKARAGAVSLPKIVGMAFGEGGADSSEILTPGENQTELNAELYRKVIDNYSFINDLTCRYECTLTEDELSGKFISEIGLYDEEGDLVCIKNFTPKGKDGDMEMTFQIDDEF